MRYCQKPKWNAKTAVEKTVEWTRVWAMGDNCKAKLDEQINEFFKG